MKTTLFILVLSCAAVAVQTQAASLSDARVTGRGGAGVALGGPHTIVLNPANVAGKPDTAFALNFGLGIFAADPGNLQDKIDTTQDDLDQLESSINDAQKQYDHDYQLYKQLKLNPQNGTYTINGTTFTISGTNVIVDGQTKTTSAFLAAQEQKYNERLDAQKKKSQQQADVVIDDLRGISDNRININLGGAFVLAVPTESISVALFARAKGKLSAYIHFADSDLDRLHQATNDGHFDKKHLDSSFTASGFYIIDYGLNIATTAKTPIGRLDYGIAAKRQQIFIADKVLDFGSDPSTSDIFDKDKNTRNASNFNLDVGATQHFGNSGFAAAAVLKNALPQDLTLPATGRTFSLRPQLTLGVSYDAGWFKAAVDVDTMNNPSFAAVLPTKNLHVGLEVGNRFSAQFRLGYIHDLLGNENNLYTVGVGLSPFDTVSLDLAGMIGQDRNYGVMLTLGVSI